MLPNWVKRLDDNPWRTNTYVLFGGTQALVVDPAVPPDEIRKVLGGRRVFGVLLTHPHVDHMLTLREVLEEFSAPLFAGEEAEEALLNSALNLSAYTEGEPLEGFEPEVPLGDGDILGFVGLEFEVLEVPGHAPGSICLLERKKKVALTGDLLFAESVGRTDLPGGSDEALAESLSRLVELLDDDWLILPGHGPEATFREIKRLNPLLWEYTRKLRGS